jgi:hypothetical protein
VLYFGWFYFLVFMNPPTKGANNLFFLVMENKNLKQRQRQLIKKNIVRGYTSSKYISHFFSLFPLYVQG